MTEPTTGLRDLLQIRDFRLLWFAQVISDFGDNLTFLTLLFLVQRLTGSTVALAGLAIAVTIPSLVFGLISGVYVDRWDRRRVMIASDLLRGIAVLLFVTVRSAEFIWLIYMIAFVQASIGTMFNPARGAFLPHVVGPDKLLSANSISQTSRIIFNLAGTAAAGVLAGFLTELWPAFIIDALSFFASALLIARIAIRPATQATPTESADKKLWHELFEGFGVVRRSRPLIGVLMAGAIAMLGLGAVNVLLVPLIVGDLKVSESWFGLIEGSQVIGMVISGVVVAVLAARFKASTMITVGITVVGSMIIAIAGIDAVWQMMLILFVVGLGVVPVQSAATTLAQLLIPDEVRGRVGASMSTAVSAANIVSMGFAGVLAAGIGVRNVFVVSGVTTIAAGAISWLIFRGADLSPAEQPVSAET